MIIDLITKQDLENLKNEILNAISSNNESKTTKKWLRSAEVREMLGISPGTLQNMRIHGHLPYSKIGGTLFYDLGEITKILNQNGNVG